MAVSKLASKTTALFSFGIMATLFIETPYLSLVVIIIGIIWFTPFQLKKPWIYDLLFGIFLVFIAIGALFEISSFWIFTTLALILFAYDLNSSVIRTMGIEENKTLQEIENRHLLRSTITIFIGVGIAAAAVNTEIESNFGQLFFLGLLLIISLNFTIGAIQNLYKNPQ